MLRTSLRLDVEGLEQLFFLMDAKCVGWFGLPLDNGTCFQLGGGVKQTIIYELDLLASILGLDFWAGRMRDSLQVWYGDNDSARFSLIRGSCLSPHASALMRYNLERKASNNLCTWYARVPTEAHVSDFPSRNAAHPLLTDVLDESAAALVWFAKPSVFLLLRTS